MSLRTDYKDDKFSGMRKYHKTDNEDGTISLEDVTSYEQSGDVFSAGDINATNEAVNSNTTNKIDYRDIVDNLSSEDFQKPLAASQGKALKEEIDFVKAVKYATFRAGGWSADAPYKQTVAVSGVEGTDSPVISLYIPSVTSAAEGKNQTKAWGYVDRGETGNGTLTLYCLSTKPASDFQVMIKGK